MRQHMAFVANMDMMGKTGNFVVMRGIVPTAEQVAIGALLMKTVSLNLQTVRFNSSTFYTLQQ